MAGAAAGQRRTLVALTVIPSARSSPTIRTAPQVRLSRIIRRIRAWVSASIRGRPPRARLRQVQDRRHAVRCQRTTVAGSTSWTCAPSLANRARRSTRSADPLPSTAPVVPSAPRPIAAGAGPGSRGPARAPAGGSAEARSGTAADRATWRRPPQWRLAAACLGATNLSGWGFGAAQHHYRRTWRSVRPGQRKLSNPEDRVPAGKPTL